VLLEHLYCFPKGVPLQGRISDAWFDAIVLEADDWDYEDG